MPLPQFIDDFFLFYRAVDAKHSHGLSDLKSDLFAKIYISVDIDKRRSEKYLFEKAHFQAILSSRSHRCCKNQTFCTKKAWRDELS